MTFCPDTAGSALPGVKRRSPVRGVAVALLVVLAGCSTYKDDFSSAPPSLHVGQVALDAGEPAIAVSVATTQLDRDPTNLDALLLRASAQATLGQTEPAIAGFRQVLAANPGSAAAALGLSRLITVSDPTETEAVLGAVAAHGDATAAVWNNLGVARDLLNRHVEAQDAYRKALAADPSMQGAQVNLARSLALAPAAPASPAPPVRIVPPTPAPPPIAPALPLAPRAPDQATVPAQGTTPVQPAAPQPVASMPGAVQTGTVPPQACMDPAAPAPTDANVANIGLFDTSQQQQEALRLAEAALQCNPSNLVLLHNAIYAAIDLGDYSRARIVSDQAIQVAPNDARSYKMSADTDRARGDYAHALAALLKARALLEPANAKTDTAP